MCAVKSENPDFHREYGISPPRKLVIAIAFFREKDSSVLFYFWYFLENCFLVAIILPVLARYFPSFKIYVIVLRKCSLSLAIVKRSHMYNHTNLGLAVHSSSSCSSF